MLKKIPSIIIAALKGGSGKTVVSLGLTKSLNTKGHIVAPFKKGPDFIDSGWLTLAADRSCYNLDPFMMTSEQITRSFLSNSNESDISLIEGNRGIFDGLDVDGCCSTAELAKLLGVPVLLILDVTMSTRTAAALVMGCQKFDPDVKIAGIILNRVAGKRQENLVKDSIKRYCNLPIVGSLPKNRENLFPERHMGLVPHQEREEAERAIHWAREIVEESLDIDFILKVARDTDPIDIKEDFLKADSERIPDSDPPRIGFIRDGAFWFYYPENLDYLKVLGARIVEINSIVDRKLPDLDALYIGGGFPETKAEALAKNKSFRVSLKKAIETGLPVYAECGGLIYMGEALITGDSEYPMVDALPIKFMMEKKPQGHGYTILKVKRGNPFFKVGDVLKGHEFHYSRPIFTKKRDIKPIFNVRRGNGLNGTDDGILKNNLLATYTHLHAAGNKLWGDNFYKLALNFKNHEKKIL